jgi:excisionase family DNA binding protein
MSDSKTPHLAFTEIMSAYQERVDTSRSIPAIDHSEPRGGKASYEHRPSVVQPIVSDFICDTEIAARRSLISAEFGYWTLYYKSCAVVVEAGDTDCLQEHVNSFPEKYRKAVASIDKRIREKLGAHLLKVGIYPLNVYLEPRDVYGRKCKTKAKVLEWSEQNSFDIQACADEPIFEPLLGVPEAAKLLCVHPKTLQALARSGAVPCVRFGKYWRFRASVLDAWIQDRLSSDHQSRRAS